MGWGAFIYDPFGRLRGRSIASIPNSLAILRAQSSSPNGRPRCTLVRSDASSDAEGRRFTRAIQMTRPEKDMLVIGCQTIGGDVNFGLDQGFGVSLFKSAVVTEPLE